MNGEIILEKDGRTVVIKDISIEDENLYEILQGVEENKRLEHFKTILRIGAIGLRRMVVGEEVDFVEKEFNSLLSKFDEMFDPLRETSHLGKLAKLLKEFFDQGGKLEKLLDPSIEYTPLGKLRIEILRELRDLRESIAKEEATTKIKEITTLKGYEFEDKCEEILSEFVSKSFGDELVRTTKEVGEVTKSFAGDFVITLRDHPDKKIVLEVKDKENITFQEIVESLENAMKNRNAAYGIFISKYKEALPQKVGWFNEFRGNMLVCALGSKKTGVYFPEILNIAYQWAKLRIEKRVSVEENIFETITESMRKLEAELNAFSQLKTQCSSIEKATERIRELSDKIKGNIKGEIEKINTSMRAMTGKENNEPN